MRYDRQMIALAITVVIAWAVVVGLLMYPLV